MYCLFLQVPGIDGALEVAAGALAYGGLLDAPADVFVPRFAADYCRFGLAAS